MSPTVVYQEIPNSVPSHCNPLQKLANTDSWIPRSLQRRTLIAFAAAYLTIIIALTVMFLYSNEHNGLASSDQNLHYLWTFGPTAVFTIIAALWTKVEYHTKQLAPWRALAHGPSSAKRTLLRDYISPWTIRTLISSLQSGDYDVTLSITGGLFLQLLIIFSTGLLALEQRTMSNDDITLVKTSRFSESNGPITAHAFSNAMATLVFGNDQPYGATDTFAYQTIDASEIPPNVTVTATVDALYPDLICEVVDASLQFTFKGSSLPEGPTYTSQLTIFDASCPMKIDQLDWVPAEISTYNLEHSFGPCNPPKQNVTQLSDRKWWIWISHFGNDDRNQTWVTPFRNTSDRDGKASLSCIACEPTIETRKARITTNGIRRNASIISDEPPSNQSDIFAWNIHASVLQTSAYATETFDSAKKGALHVPNDLSLETSLFILMNTSMPRNSLEDWMDTGFLKEAIRRVYQRVAVHVLLEQFSTNTNEITNGTATWIENRLIVRSLSFYLSVTILSLLIAVAAILCLDRPLGLVPYDPGSIARLASIMSSSPGMVKILEGSGHSASINKVNLTDSGPFQSGVIQDTKDTQFQIRPSDSPTNEEVRESQQKWWQPFSFTVHGKLLTLSAPIAGIIALEVLYQNSLRKQGIASVSSNLYINYTWVYIPALIMWGINVLIADVYFNSIVIHPYYTLRHRSKEASQALRSNLMSKYIIENTWIAFKSYQYTLLLSSITVLLGGILPIVVAGLYSPDITSHTLSIQPLQKTWFNASQGFYGYTEYSNTSHLNVSHENRDPIANLILYNNFSSPRWTFGPYALSEIDFANIDLSNMNLSRSTVTAQVPAVRARVNCTIVREQDVHFTGFTQLQSQWSAVSAGFQPPMPERCIELESPASAQDFYYYGRFVRGDRCYNASATNSPAGNQSLPFAFVEFWKPDPPYKGNDLAMCAKEVTFAPCWPYVEQVILQTTFSYPSWDILSATPLPPDPKIQDGYPFFSAAEVVTRMGDPHMDGEPVYWGNFLTSPNIVVDQTHFFDLFMQAVIWGKNGIPVAELVGRANEQRLLERVDEVYGLIMAQLYNSQARIPASPNSSKLNVAVIAGDRFRVMQSLIATRILEGVLACMLLCCIVAFFSLDAKELLPQNPCSIGAAASYIAGSKLCDQTWHLGRKFLSGTDSPKRKVLESYEFGFGWHSEGGTRRYGIFIQDKLEQDTSSESTENLGNGSLLQYRYA